MVIAAAKNVTRRCRWKQTEALRRTPASAGRRSRQIDGSGVRAPGSDGARTPGGCLQRAAPARNAATM